MDNESGSLKIVQIRFQDLKRTNTDFIHKIFSPLYSVNSVDDLKRKLSSIMHKVNRLSIFKESSIDITESDSSSEGLVLTFRGIEKNYSLKAGTEVQKDDVAFRFGGHWINILGKGESLEANASYGLACTTPLSLSFKKPLYGDPDRVLEFFLSSCSSGRQIWQPYKCKTDQAGSAISFPLGDNGTNVLKAVICQRTAYDFIPTSSPSYLNHAGTVVKASLINQSAFDRRDDRVLPTKGSLWKHQTEISTIQGNCNFMKQEAYGQISFPIHRLLTLGISGRCGFIKVVNGNHNLLSSLDKFHMGGPNSIRGFQVNSLGPKEASNTLGATYVAESCVNLSFPLSESLKIVRGHLFLNSGVLTNQLSHLTRQKLYSSFGCGIVANLGGARFEMNACYPVVNNSLSYDDITRPSIQIGIGMDFL